MTESVNDGADEVAAGVASELEDRNLEAEEREVVLDAHDNIAGHDAEIGDREEVAAEYGLQNNWTFFDETASWGNADAAAVLLRTQ